MIQYKLPDYFLIDPNLRDDHFERKGEIGLLVYGYEEDDHYFLRFEDSEIYSYESKQMLTFRPIPEILDFLDTNGRELKRTDFNGLYNIALLLEYGTFDNQKKALELAKASEKIIEVGMFPLSASLERTSHLRVGR